MASCSEPVSNVSSNVVKIINCSRSTTDACTELIKELSGDNSMNNSTAKWLIDNKYYTATVCITIHQEPSAIVNDTPLQGLVFVGDLDEQLDYLENVNKLWSTLNDEAPPICLLVGVIRGVANDTTSIVKWCTDNGVEFIAWNITGKEEKKGKEEEEEEEEEEGGVDRISQALQAHMWPEMTLKGTKPTKQHNAPSTTENKTKEKEPSFEDVLVYDPLKSNKGVEPDPGGESFEDLFERFASMKAHAETLPFEERKVYAEKVVMSFWKAIGGDEEELDLEN